jgi:hypothetical protein
MRHIPTPLGIGLVVIGFTLLTSPLAALLFYGGVALVLTLVITAAVIRRKRSGKRREWTPAKELSEWERFVTTRRRWALRESAIYVFIAAALIWLDGLTLGTVLVAAGFGLLLIARWFIEPRTWEEVTRRLAAPP